MGLTMGERMSVTRETAVRYRKADKAGKQRILDEFTETTGYHRKYAIQMLNQWGKERLRIVEGKPVKFVVGRPRKRKKRKGRRIYGEAVHKALEKLWELYDYMCGKRLAVLLRVNIDVLSSQPEFGIDEEVRDALVRISPATIDRMLAPQRKKLELKGRGHTRAGTLLKHQIPIRASFDWDERLPGFFELDTVGHEGGSSYGQYCFTLDATDVFSGWVELRALRNRAHRWVKEQVIDIRAQLPFPIKGVDSDNGGEFINEQLFSWCKAEHIQFTRGRPYRKNDNCFVEQKNDMTVRRTVGYYRFDTEAEYQALKEVYKYLCPLLNFFYPSVRIIEKIREGARVKKVYDKPQTAFARLMQSEKVDEEVKEELVKRKQKLHVVKQKRLVDQAVARLMRLYEQKKQYPLAGEANSRTAG